MASLELQRDTVSRRAQQLIPAWPRSSSAELKRFAFVIPNSRPCDECLPDIQKDRMFPEKPVKEIEEQHDTFTDPFHPRTAQHTTRQILTWIFYPRGHISRDITAPKPDEQMLKMKRRGRKKKEIVWKGAFDPEHRHST